MIMSRRLTIQQSVLFSLAIFFLLAHCSVTPPRTYETGQTPAFPVVLISAYDPELTELLTATDIRDSCLVEGTAYYTGSLAGHDVILFLSGIGLDNAAATTQTLLDTFQVRGIVFSGIAGGINPGLRIGDVAVPERWGWADGPLDPRDESFWIPVDHGMLEVASKVAQTVDLAECTPDSVCLEHTPVVEIGGNGVSNSFFVDDAVYREWLWETFEANAVDMETAAVALIAHEAGIPFIAFRSLSDLAGGGPGENELETFFQLAANNPAAVVTVFLETWAAELPDTASVKIR